jgi:acetyl-CoA synthetase
MTSESTTTTTKEADGDVMMEETHVIPTEVPPIVSNKSTNAIATTLETYKEKHQFSITNPNLFWFQQASERLSWFSFPFDETSKVCQGGFANGDVTWFANAKLNICYNAVDRHVEIGNGNKIAMIWEGDEVDEIRHITFYDMQRKISQICHVLANHGVTKGSVVTIYMPMSMYFKK